MQDLPDAGKITHREILQKHRAMQEMGIAIQEKWHYYESLDELVRQGGGLDISSWEGGNVIDKWSRRIMYWWTCVYRAIKRHYAGYRSRIYDKALCLSRLYPVEVTAVDEENMTAHVSHGSEGNTKETGSRMHNIPAGTGKKCQGKGNA